MHLDALLAAADPNHPEETSDAPVVRRLRIDHRRHLFLHDGRECHLEPRTFALMNYLIEHAGGVVTKEEILAIVWQGRYVTENVVARGIMKLRRVLSSVPEPSARIVTVHRIGYRLQWLDAQAPSIRPLSLHPQPRLWGDF